MIGINEFRYTHRDGRKGEGWSSWAAIVAALGAAEAQALPELRENVWVDCYIAGEPSVIRQSRVETQGEETIGQLERLA